jgi:outer membrane biosynthesis protein TonB
VVPAAVFAGSDHGGGQVRSLLESILGAAQHKTAAIGDRLHAAAELATAQKAAAIAASAAALASGGTAIDKFANHDRAARAAQVAQEQPSDPPAGAPEDPSLPEPTPPATNPDAPPASPPEPQPAPQPEPQPVPPPQPPRNEFDPTGAATARPAQSPAQRRPEPTFAPAGGGGSSQGGGEFAP